jgi:hypothetical protein
MMSSLVDLSLWCSMPLISFEILKLQKYYILLAWVSTGTCVRLWRVGLSHGLVARNFLGPSVQNLLITHKDQTKMILTSQFL